MGTTTNRQKEAKKDLDHKLALSTPDRQLLEELAVKCATEPSSATTFQYAFALSKSTEPSELRYAVNMLDSLVVEGKFEHQVDCMYGAATALYLLGDYDEARVSVARTNSRDERKIKFLTVVSTVFYHDKVSMRSYFEIAAECPFCQGIASGGDRSR